MPYVAELGDHLDDLAGALERSDGQLRRAAERLGEVDADDIGPDIAATDVRDVLARLERQLGTLAQDCADAVTAVRRHLGDRTP